jgi:hypothetical protein
VFSRFEILDVALLRLRFQKRCGLGLNQNYYFRMDTSYEKTSDI